MPVSNNRLSQVVAICFLCCLFAAGLVFVELQFHPPIASVDLGGKLSQTQAKAVDVVLGLAALFVTFALSLLGGIAFFLSSVVKREINLREPARPLLFIAGILGILSLFFGHLVYGALIDMLANNILVFHASFLVWPIRLQYILLLLALLLFLSAVVIATAPERAANASNRHVARRH